MANDKIKMGGIIEKLQKKSSLSDEELSILQSSIDQLELRRAESHHETTSHHHTTAFLDLGGFKQVSGQGGGGG